MGKYLECVHPSSFQSITACYLSVRYLIAKNNPKICGKDVPGAIET